MPAGKTGIPHQNTTTRLTYLYRPWVSEMVMVMVMVVMEMVMVMVMVMEMVIVMVMVMVVAIEMVSRRWRWSLVEMGEMAMAAFIRRKSYRCNGCRQWMEWAIFSRKTIHKCWTVWDIQWRGRPCRNKV